MRKQILILLFTCNYLLAGCSTVGSSYHYTKGTEYLQSGNFSNAVAELEQAVKLDPQMARNHTNLSAAYLNLGKGEEAWYHSRQAVLSPYPDDAGPVLFALFCDLLITKQGLSKADTPFQKVIDSLGEPDLLVKSNGSSRITCMYGTCTMEFENEALTSCSLNQDVDNS